MGMDACKDGTLSHPHGDRVATEDEGDRLELRGRKKLGLPGTHLDFARYDQPRCGIQ